MNLYEATNYFLDESGDLVNEGVLDIFKNIPGFKNIYAEVQRILKDPEVAKEWLKDHAKDAAEAKTLLGIKNESLFDIFRGKSKYVIMAAMIMMIGGQAVMAGNVNSDENTRSSYHQTFDGDGDGDEESPLKAKLSKIKDKIKDRFGGDEDSGDDKISFQELDANKIQMVRDKLLSGMFTVDEIITTYNLDDDSRVILNKIWERGRGPLKH